MKWSGRMCACVFLPFTTPFFFTSCSPFAAWETPLSITCVGANVSLHEDLAQFVLDLGRNELSGEIFFWFFSLSLSFLCCYFFVYLFIHFPLSSFSSSRHPASRAAQAGHWIKSEGVSKNGKQLFTLFAVSYVFSFFCCCWRLAFFFSCFFFFVG